MMRGKHVLVGWLWVQGLIQPLEGNPNHGHSEYKAFLQHHSFAVPLEYSSLLADWTLSGASIFERERLLLHPGVSERQGFAWNKQPLQTNNFEASFAFRAFGAADASKVVDDQSFAFWFVRQNISGDFNESAAIRASSWSDGLKEQGYSLSGSKALFEGIGAVFSTANLAKKPGSVVSFISNDNHQSLGYGIDVPTSNAKVVDFRNKDVEFKIRVQPFSVKGQIIVDGNVEDCFDVDRRNFPVKAGGYIGFTAWSGSVQPSKLPDGVSLTKVQVVNFDDQAVGEDIVGTSAKDKLAYEALMSEDSRYFQDQQAQTEHIGRITTMLSAHLNETKPAYDVMSFQVSNLMQSLNKLDHDCRLLTKEMKVLTDPKNAKAPKKATNLQEMKVHILGLRRLLDKEGAAHMHKLEAVQKNLNEVKQQTDKAAGSSILGRIVDQTTVLEQSVVSRSSQMSQAYSMD
ncbi:unnamed protein product [Symbiodinium natans]|uniref:L-type lectin-like domain-containing protein n=1 Tax=Symbiodinium natans TaxID=878477 RepID=A0A812LNR0_9DINO|nr:unnamed protein product [Symbiodinium natans]